MENTVNYNEAYNNGGVLQQGTNLISGKWYVAECWVEGASPKAKIEWSIEGNGTLADEIPSPPIVGRISVIEVSNVLLLPFKVTILLYKNYF